MEPARTEGMLFRRLLALVLLAGEIGLLLELVLLEHMEDTWQWAPVVVLALAVPISALVAVRPSRAAVRALAVFAAVMVAAGLLGMYLHYRGNVEFEVESDPALRGWSLFRLAMQGATPALAPGALVQLGLVALLAVFRHPALVKDPSTR